MGEVDVELRRSGWVEWNCLSLNVADEPAALLVLPLAYAANLVSHLLVFRGGWTLHVYAEGAPPLRRKIRYRRKRHAEADLPHYRRFAAEYAAEHPLPPPVRLPTRGGQLRRPW